MVPVAGTRRIVVVLRRSLETPNGIVLAVSGAALISRKHPPTSLSPLFSNRYCATFGIPWRRNIYTVAGSGMFGMILWTCRCSFVRSSHI